jgi:uncharacterized protein YyaL (SSP411 family)
MTTQALNSLAKASSAYLRSAMHQPIHWHEWGSEAFAVAQRENKPILLDIGAVWCHWCHVMDRESYDDPEVAQIVNEHFIAVKVDRDERPDIDSRYQVAVSSITGQGGWPLTTFLTPDGKPFYGGTYFPPEDHWGRPGFKRVLLSIANAFREKLTEVAEQATMVESAISQAESLAGRSGEFKPSIVDAIIESAMEAFDPVNGGFGHAPKFPHPATLDLLIDRYVRTGDERARHAFVTTLEKMGRGGVYDQLAGGFHRYSVDERWVVPHFEKMGYDNSELLKSYVHAYQATGVPFFAGIARDIVRWMDEWLSDREHGGFFASQDADYSMNDDGDYFTWTLAEAQEVLTGEEVEVASLRFDINEVGEMHHNPAKNVLFVRAPLEEIAKRLALTVEQVDGLLTSAKKKMYEARLQRPTPYVDKTMYTGWNSMCVSAYLQAARALNLANAQSFALRSLDRILAEAWQPERGLRHVIAYSDSVPPTREVVALLDDYALTVTACLDAYEHTADLSYFTFARRIADWMIDKFFDSTTGGFFDTSREADTTLGVLSARRKPFQDSPTPAGNSVAAIALMRLHSYTHESSYWDKAEQTMETFAGTAERYGIFAGTYGLAAVRFSSPHTQVIVVGNDDEAERLLASVGTRFVSDAAVLRFTHNEINPANLPPVLAQTLPELPALQEGKSFAVLCSGFACQPPLHDPAELAHSIAKSIADKSSGRIGSPQ